MDHKFMLSTIYTCKKDLYIYIYKLLNIIFNSIAIISI